MMKQMQKAKAFLYAQSNSNHHLTIKVAISNKKGLTLIQG